jgi:hypothetical protein
MLPDNTLPLRTAGDEVLPLSPSAALLFSALDGRLRLIWSVPPVSSSEKSVQ